MLGARPVAGVRVIFQHSIVRAMGRARSPVFWLGHTLFYRFRSTGRGDGDAVDTRQRWSVVIPVKRLSMAKSRLAEFAGERRPEMALAVACDTVRAVTATPEVAAIFVVTEDATAAAALERFGAHVVTGEPGTGLNAALRHGAARARLAYPDAGVCALSADLPALRPAELSQVLAAAATYPNAFLADAHGVGTTVYSALPRAVFAPAFEGWSRLRHRQSGAVELELAGVPTVRHDVDTPEDLWAAARLGVGPHTAALLDSLGLARTGG